MILLDTRGDGQTSIGSFVQTDGLLFTEDGEGEKVHRRYFLNGSDRQLVFDTIRPSSDGRGEGKKKRLPFETAKTRTFLGRRVRGTRVPGQRLGYRKLFMN